MEAMARINHPKGHTTVTLSVDDRRENLKEALIGFLDVLGDRSFSNFWIDPNEFPEVLATTWTDLTAKYWLREMNWNIQMYQFTPSGYVQALRISGRAKDTQFREDLGKICKVLKDSVKGRASFSFFGLHELAKESGVSVTFAQNAIDADLIRYVLGRVGARWEGDSLVIKVPHNFGLTPL